MKRFLFFFEKKNQKTLMPFGFPQPRLFPAGVTSPASAL
jgi:hypothetical protein